MAPRAQERILIDHDEIRRWAEERGAVPTRVKGTGGPNDVGIVRLHFPEFSHEGDEKLEEISWDEFFEEFDKKRLALLVEDRMPNGGRSNFNKIVSRSTIEDFVREAGRRGGRQPRSRTRAASSSSAKRGSTAKVQPINASSRKRSASSGRPRSRRPAA